MEQTPPKSAHCAAMASAVRSIEEFQNTTLKTEATLVLLQFGSPVCTLCPAFSEKITELSEIHSFKWLYCDAHEDNDLVEFFGISKLPAYLIAKRGNPHPVTAKEAATPDEVHESLKQYSVQNFRLDEDF
jgi:thiol-disulfide isomerase/thioredoxin